MNSNHNNSSSEHDIIKKEIKEIINNLIRGCETFNMELAFQVFFDSPDFLMMGTDGTLVDYQTYIKNNIDYLNTCSKFRLTTKNEEIRILNCEVAIYAWHYTAEAILKTGERDIFESAGASFIFKKVNDKWRVIYYHESSSPLKREKNYSSSGACS